MTPPTEQLHEYEPDRVLPPGVTLLEWLEEHHMSQAELARRAGLSTKHISQVVNGAAGLSPEVALALDNVTGISARSWTQLEANYRTFAALEAEARDLAEHVNLLDRFPIKELIRRKKLSSVADPPRQLRELLRFFGVANVDALEKVCLSGTKLRVSRAFAPDEAALASWLRLAELEAQEATVVPFDAKECEQAIPDFRRCTMLEDAIWLHALTERCATVGISLVMLREIPKCRVNGATRWLAPDKAMIALSPRHKRHDVVWFSFFHELGHLLRHSRKQTFVDAPGSQVAADLELDADRFASRILVAPEYETALREVATKADAKALAERLGVDVAIIVGRLQHERLIPFNRWNTLVRRYRFSEDD